MVALGVGVRSAPVMFCWSAHVGVRLVEPVFATLGYVDGFGINGDVTLDASIYFGGIEARPHLIGPLYGLATFELGVGSNHYDAGETKRTIPSWVAESKLGLEAGKHVYGRLLAGGLFRRSDGIDFEHGTELGVAVVLQLGVRAL